MQRASRAHEGAAGGRRRPQERRLRTLSALPATAFWFLRHGETDWNAQNLSQGGVDIPLNENGLAQARAAAPLLKNRGIRTLVSSPMIRARVTAEIVAAELGLAIQFDPELREVSFGKQEGQPMAGAWFAEWVEGKATPEGAESFVALRERAAKAITRALANPAPVLVVAHGALFRALRADMGLEPNVRTANAMPFLCEPATPAWNLVPAAELPR